MGFAIIAWDGPDPARRAVWCDRPMAVTTRWAAEGRVALGTPLFTPAGLAAGSLVVLGAPDRAGLDADMAEESFAVDGVWGTWAAHPFGLAPLPYRALPGAL